MFDPREPCSSRLGLSEPAETTKLAVADAEHSIDCAMSQLHLDAVSVIRALLQPAQAENLIDPATATEPRSAMLRRVSNHVERSRTHLLDALIAARTLSKSPQLIAADRAEIELAVSDVTTAQITLSEVGTMLGATKDAGDSKLAGAGERLMASLSRARNSTCAAYQRLEEIPTVMVRAPLTT